MVSNIEHFGKKVPKYHSRSYHEVDVGFPFHGNILISDSEFEIRLFSDFCYSSSPLLCWSFRQNLRILKISRKFQKLGSVESYYVKKIRAFA